MKNYHEDDQRLAWEHHWGCQLFGGQIEHYASIATGFGVFVNWKISGAAYNDYADYRVGSPITTHYHWWDTSDYDWYGPIIRAGGSFEYSLIPGIFSSMCSKLSTSNVVLGS